MTPSDSGFTHNAAIYSSDKEFVEAAAPFIVGGIAAGEPVLVTTTAANLRLVRHALDHQTGRVEYAETTYFGRRPIDRITAFHRYWRHHAAAGATRVRVLAEPVWAGNPADQIVAWQRMESCLNLVLADTGISMLCPYDTRSCEPGILAAARRTHPHHVSGITATSSSAYTDPHAFAEECDALPLSPVPADAATLRLGASLRALRAFVADEAGGRGMTAERVALLVLAVGEAAAYLKRQLYDGAAPTVRVWSGCDAVVCEVHQPAGRITDPALGLRPPDITPPRPGDGIHLAHHLCERLDIRSTDAGCTIRLYARGDRSEELATSAAPYT